MTDESEGPLPGWGPPPPDDPYVPQHRFTTGQAITMSVVALILGLGIGLAIGLVAAPDDGDTDLSLQGAGNDEDEDPPLERGESRSTTTTAEDDDGPGTKDDPIALGDAAVVERDGEPEWEIKVVGFMPNANDAVKAANQFNKPPAPGHQFAMVAVEATYIGDNEPQKISEGVAMSAIDSGNVAYDLQNDCGVFPNELPEYSDVYEGGKITGNVCWSVASDKIASLLLVVQPWGSGEGSVFMAVQ